MTTRHMTTQLHDTWVHSYMIHDYTATWYMTTQLHDTWLHSYMIHDYTATWYMTTQLHDTWLHSYMIHDYTPSSSSISMRSPSTSWPTNLRPFSSNLATNAGFTWWKIMHLAQCRQRVCKRKISSDIAHYPVLSIAERTYVNIFHYFKRY